MKKEHLEKEHLETQNWNKKKKDSHFTFYLLMAGVCFVIAWLISGAI